MLAALQFRDVPSAPILSPNEARVAAGTGIFGNKTASENSGVVMSTAGIVTKKSD